MFELDIHQYFESGADVLIVAVLVVASLFLLAMVCIPGLCVQRGILVMASAFVLRLHQERDNANSDEDIQFGTNAGAVVGLIWRL